MGTLIGRTYELQEGRRLLKAARKQRVGRLFRIAGPSGIGKTAIARALADEASADGWVVIFAAAHHIQSGLPMVFAQRILRALIEGLGSSATRYTSGLDLEKPEASLLPLLDAMLIDTPVAIVADDAQWADQDSRTLLVRVLQALADRPLAVISTERNDEADSEAFEFSDVTVVVGEMDHRSSEALVRYLLPSAPNEIISALAEHGRGRAIDIVSLARALLDSSSEITLDDVAATLRALVARELSLLDADEREFLQLCSLIAEPIDYVLLRQLFKEDDRLLTLINKFSGRFLVQRGEHIFFAHAAIGQSIRETIAIDVPYRKRIFEALAHLSTPRLEDYERLVEQARAMGDRTLEKQQLGNLIDEATRQQVHAVAARAIERILEIAPFTAAQSLALYSRLSLQYNALSRDGDTHRVCMQGLDYALSHGINSGLGQLVLSDLFALFFRGDYAAYNRTLATFDVHLKSSEDRGYLVIGKLFRAVYEFDDDAHDAAVREFETIDAPDPTLRVRIDVFSGFHRARRGDLDTAFDMFERAKTDAQLLNPLLSVMVNSGELMMAFQTLGADHPRTKSALDAVAEDTPSHAYFSALQLLLTGQFRDATEVAAEALVNINGVYARRQLLGVAAMSAILSAEPLPSAMRAAINAEAPRTSRDRIVGSQLPLATWVCLDQGGSNGIELLRTIVEFAIRQPVEPMTLFFPIVLVKAATAFQRSDILEQIERGSLARDSLALTAAQHELARLSAASVLGKPLNSAEVIRTEHALTMLGATYFAELTRELVAKTAPRSTHGVLTRREHEVTALVADGRTNREIAEHLVISERTVEAHIANIFGKIGASSRSHVAVWYAAGGGHS